MDKKRELLFLTGILVAAVICRGLLLGRDLEYDEIWSLMNYSQLPVGKIFTDLATPNNHPLNTVLIKLLWFSRDYPWTIRLGSLFFSLGSVVLLYALGKMFYRRYGAWYAAAAGAFLPPLIVSGATARGYAGQLFFLLLCAYALLKCRKGSLFWSISAAASGIAAILALYSSILYLFPLGIFFLLYQFRKRRILPVHWITFSLAALLAAAWYGMNFTSFRQSQQFQEHIGSFTAFYCWLDSALAYNAIAPAIVPLAWFCRRKKRLPFILVTLIVFPLLAAAVTAPAPGRVYLPGIAAAILLLVPGCKLKKFRLPATVLLLAMQIAVSWKVLPDTKVINEMINYDQCRGIITLYGANESFPVAWNHPRAVEIFFRQLSAGSAMDRCMLFTAEKQISGVNAAGDTRFMNIAQNKFIPVSGNTPPYLLSLQKTSNVAENSTAFLLLPPAPAAVTAAKLKSIKAKELLYLNCWLTTPLSAPDGTIHRFALVTFTASEAQVYPKELPIFIPDVEK
ncbi:MAG: glycosyltransferase family 39 protein [Lentisphaeria bacterium]|nr:glycosyltransferase family 39 protein [Lentisphaeria bacterium]